MDLNVHEANGPIALQVQRVCNDTLPWLISVSLGLCRRERIHHLARIGVPRGCGKRITAYDHREGRRLPRRPVTDAIITASRRPLNESKELKGMLAMFPLDTTGTNAKGEFALRTDTRSHFLEVSSDRLHARRLLSHFSTSGNVITLK
jgi:hypothetical protein